MAVSTLVPLLSFYHNAENFFKRRTCCLVQSLCGENMCVISHSIMGGGERFCQSFAFAGIMEWYILGTLKYAILLPPPLMEWHKGKVQKCMGDSDKVSYSITPQKEPHIW